MGDGSEKEKESNIDLFLFFLYLYTIHQELWWVIYGLRTYRAQLAATLSQSAQQRQRRRVEILKYFLNSVALLARIALDASSDA